jgi:hypothetical protein
VQEHIDEPDDYYVQNNVQIRVCASLCQFFQMMLLTAQFVVLNTVFAFGSVGAQWEVHIV